VVVVVLLDGSPRIPESETQGRFVEESATRLNAVAPGHQGLAGDAQVAELHSRTLLTLLLLLTGPSPLIAAQDHSVDGLVHGYHCGGVVRVAVHRSDDPAGGSDH